MTDDLKSLTPTQQKAFDYICQVFNESNSTPTLRELCSFMGYSAVGSAQDLIASLRKKGYLRSPEKQKARSLGITEAALSTLKKTAENLNMLEIPCLGSVPAGNPIEAVEQKVATLRVSTAMFRSQYDGSQRLFAVRAEGLSMINAGIYDGDWLVVEGTRDAIEGDIVVARVDGDATVKRLARDPGGWLLNPENDDFSPIRAMSDEGFDIVGKVVALQRFL